ncbi:MAG: cation diffusion facilitator family transporter [Thermoleophilia bacterium]|nr:cation diffusion facilitator family transporter [Thermoleophilia bacterium]
MVGIVSPDNLVEAKRRERLVAKRRTARRFTLVNLMANGALAVGKGLVGLLTGSLSITADAMNSLADTAYSIMLIVGMRFSLQPADRGHPQGHRGLEPLLSLVIGVSITVVCLQLVVRGARGLFAPPEIERSLWTVPVLFGAMGVKAALAVGAKRSSDNIHSPALRAVSNDAIADVLSSLAALAGYLGAGVGLELADPLFSLVVAAFVGRTAYEVLHENVGYIVGRTAPPEVERRVMEVACAPEMVCAVHDLKAYFRGPELHVSFHLEIDEGESLQAVHDLEQRIRLALLDMPEIDDVSVHLDPVERSRPGIP